jgi:hypothetical protein
VAIERDDSWLEVGDIAHRAARRQALTAIKEMRQDERREDETANRPYLEVSLEIGLTFKKDCK